MDLSYQTYSKCDRCREGKMESYENLCYYHDKIERGLIDEPEHEIAYTDVFCEDEEQIETWKEQCKIISNSICPPESRDDAIQYASMGYRRTLASWNPEESTWATFCNTVIRNRIIDFMRKEVLYYERNELIPEDMILEDSLNPEYLCIVKADRDDLRDAISNAMIGMSDREHAVLWRRMVSDNPVTLQDLADWYGTTEASIRRDEGRIINKLREELSYE
jgi:RNA polymerase sigma factor (sigma-70 family)